MSLQQDPDLDLIAALVWLARRSAGEQLLSYADVASEIGYDAEVDVKDPEGEGEDDPGEA